MSPNPVPFPSATPTLAPRPGKSARYLLGRDDPYRGRTLIAPESDREGSTNLLGPVHRRIIFRQGQAEDVLSAPTPSLPQPPMAQALRARTR